MVKRSLLIAALSGLLLLAQLLAVNPLSGTAKHYTSQVVAASVAVYATLRTINAILSTAQEVEVGGSLVVSGTIQPLKALEPLDDTVERMASVVFAVAIATGLLTLAFGPLAALGFGMMLIAALAQLGAHKIGRPVDGASKALMRYGIVLGLVVPSAFFLSSVLADVMTKAVWDEHNEILADISDSFEQSAPGDTSTGEQASGSNEQGGFLSAVLDSVTEGTAAVAEATRATFTGVEDYTQAARVLADRADELVRSFVNILAVFLFKVLVLPLVLLGGLLVMLRGSARP